MQGTLHSVQPRRLHEEIVQQFLSLIRGGSLRHGDRLPSERVLAGQFKVSRSSVREALRSLELQGLVVSKRGSGTFINTEDLNSAVALIASTLSSGADTLRDIFEMRHLLEPQIAFLAAQMVTPQELLEMAEILEEQGRQIARGETGVNADTDFHFALAMATHNSALVKVVSAVEDILTRSRDQSLQEPGRPQRSLSSHRQILEMLQGRDKHAARRAMEHHLTSVEPANFMSYPQSDVSNQPIPRTPLLEKRERAGITAADS